MEWGGFGSTLLVRICPRVVVAMDKSCANISEHGNDGVGRRQARWSSAWNRAEG